MTTRVFGLTAPDLQKRIQPTNQEQGFKIGDGGDLSAADAVEILQASEDVALELMKEPLRRLASSCSERLTDVAYGGETSFKTTLSPVVVSSVKVYKNFPISRVWNMRDDSLKLPDTEYTISESGAISLSEPLRHGERLWVEYDHLAARAWDGVKCDILDLAAYEVSKRFEMFRDADRGLSDYQKAAETARYNLKDRSWIAGLKEPRLIADRIGESRQYDILLQLGSQ